MFSDNGLETYKDEAIFLSDLQIQYKSEVNMELQCLWLNELPIVEIFICLPSLLYYKEPPGCSGLPQPCWDGILTPWSQTDIWYKLNKIEAPPHLPPSKVLIEMEASVSLP